jgi:HAD superfamily hydrolase (TIGR01509 family)
MVRPFPPITSLKAILFDVDGTLTESDAVHYLAFRELLMKEGYNGGKPITEEFYSKNISGGFNADLGRFLFPDWDLDRQTKWMTAKEARFRQMAADKLVGKPGLSQFTAWLEKKKIRRAAVTNATRLNAEHMIAACGLTDFFEYLVIGEECERAKPFPDPYLKGLELLGVPADEAVVFEDSTSGTAAAVEAKLAVVGVISGNPEADLLKAGVAFAIIDFTDPKLWNALGEPVPSMDD